MRGLIRLVEGLQRGDTSAVYILIFAVVGTIVIFLITEIIHRRRRDKRHNRH